MEEKSKHNEHSNAEDARIEKEILTAMHEHPKIDESKMMVEVKDGTVILKGHADTEEEKEHVQLIAAAVHGVVHVENRLHVDVGIAHALSVIATRMSSDPDSNKDGN